MEGNNNNNTIEQQESQNNIQISDIISWTFSHKLFIGLSVFICVVLGVFYALRSQPVYQRESSVMIRTSQQGMANMGELAAFSDLGIFNTGIDVFNEIEAFRSPILMDRVVERLGLCDNYSSKNWIGRVIDWYDETPLKVDFHDIIAEYDEDPVEYFSFKVKTDDGGKTFTLYDFQINIEELDDEITVKAYATANTPVAKMVVSPTEFFEKNYDSPVTVSHTTVKNATKDCLDRLSAELADKKATVINFSFTDTSAKRAEDVLNTLLDVYNEDWVEYMSQSAANTSKFINERLVVIEKELGMADADVERFKSDNKLLDVELETTQMTEESSKYAEASFKVNNQLAIAKFIREYLTDQSKAFELLPANSGIENPYVEEQIAEYNKLLLERQRFADNSSDHNPVVSYYNNQIAMMRTTIQQSIDNLISTLQIQVDRLAAQENKIAGQITSNPGKVRELTSFERQQKTKEELYLYLLQKREENELSANIVVNNTRLLKPAMGSSLQKKKKKKLIVLAAFIFGLAIPYGYMFLINMTNTTIRGRKDVESLSTPILGEVPQYGKPQRFGFLQKMLPSGKEKEESAPNIVVKQHSRDMINEAYRVIRTNIDFMLSGSKESQSIMFTSYNPGSGKTFSTVNIATSMALKGKKVILVDLDIRKATLSKLVESTKNGVTSYLNGQSEIDSIIVKNCSGIDGLDIIPVGVIPPNPSELLLSERLGVLIKELKKRYDYVMIDCAPFGIIADTAIIAKSVDRTIFVMRVGRFDRRALPEIDEIYKQLPNMSILINGSMHNAGYGYSRYGYGYGYGYGVRE